MRKKAVDEHWLPSNSLWLKVEREPASSVMPEGAKAFCKDRGVTIAEEEDPDLMALWAPESDSDLQDDMVAALEDLLLLHP